MGVFRMFLEVGFAAFFLGEVLFCFGFRFAETDGKQKRVDTFFVALVEEKCETVIGFDPSVQSALKTGKEPRLNCFEF